MPPERTTILVVDDEQVVLTVAVTILRHAKFHVLSATSAQEALALCRTHSGPIHLALLDVVMPAMTGLELRECLRSEFPSIRILFMSGYCYEEMALRDIQAGPADFMQKPFTYATLVEMVSTALSQSGTMHA
jgi:two-component system cell cycle sensor histidine kinase/response regulator CckA